MSAEWQAEHFFRHEYGKLVASLARLVGVHHIQIVEDAVQLALLKAVERWPLDGQPDNASAWLFRVAKNELLSQLRTGAGRRNLLEGARQVTSDNNRETLALSPVGLSADVRDDLLRMLFVCCASEIDLQSQLVLALKTLCGFSVREIGLRLFVSEANVYKRLQRARTVLCEMPRRSFEFDEASVVSRLPAVRQVLYLLFTEGYLSGHASMSIRKELCSEALRLAILLAEHPQGRGPVSAGLVALMYLQLARFDSRQDADGGLLLLQEQNRHRFDQALIAKGLWWLSKSAHGDGFSRYHAEAGIAAEHCLAPGFAETRWPRIVSCYELLESLAPSAIHRLNRAVALAEYKGPAAGLALLQGEAPPSWLAGSYLWSAVLADFHRRLGHTEEAQRYRDAALHLAPSEAISALLRRRLLSSPTD